MFPRPKPGIEGEVACLPPFIMCMSVRKTHDQNGNRIKLKFIHKNCYFYDIHLMISKRLQDMTLT